MVCPTLGPAAFCPEARCRPEPPALFQLPSGLVRFLPTWEPRSFLREALGCFSSSYDPVELAWAVNARLGGVGPMGSAGWVAMLKPA